MAKGLRELSTMVVVIAGMAMPSAARAHFTLIQPASWASQGTLGDPQKSAPCGQADGTDPIETGTVTAFRAGETITIMVDETIFHPGHYRVVLSTTGMAGLPADPPVTAGTTACGSTVIESSPAFPLLADGMLKHTTQFSAPQSFQVTLPSNVTCVGCTLQIAEFMSEHGLNNPGGCFYHHCANISITGGTGTGGGGTSGVDGGTTPGSDSGCGCDLGDALANSWAALPVAALALALAFAGRRRLRPRAR